MYDFQLMEPISNRKKFLIKINHYQQYIIIIQYFCRINKFLLYTLSFENIKKILVLELFLTKKI